MTVVRQVRTFPTQLHLPGWNCSNNNKNKITENLIDFLFQLRYTGMLETVRIRRAGYNVRLSYDEFIQLYRILLPKGLLSTQRDVRAFMDKMHLNKQHFQLGNTKIYMRESQKINLDYKLHTKIIDSIIMIQRWFKSKMQREKFLSLRSAAIKIQSCWRVRLAQNKVYQMRVQWNAAVVIQAAFRMYRQRKHYKKLINGLVLVQARVRGRAARMRLKRFHRQKVLKDRYKLRSTQSLPINDRSPDTDAIDIDMTRSYANRLQHSVDETLESDQHALMAAEQKFRSLMISPKNEPIANERPSNDNSAKSRILSEESVDSRTSRSYNIDLATKQYFDDSLMVKRLVFLALKPFFISI